MSLPKIDWERVDRQLVERGRARWHARNGRYTDGTPMSIEDRQLYVGLTQASHVILTVLALLIVITLIVWVGSVF